MSNVSLYDLHTHSVLSDGVLGPSELVRRYEAKGYRGIVVADHVDAATLDVVLPQIVKFCNEAARYFKKIQILPGCELTHLPLGTFGPMIERARQLGAKVVIAHGETIVEPVPKGTNREAILSGADILAHPGLIEEDDSALAKEHNVCLEITSRSGHAFTNAHVAHCALKKKATLVYSSDFHEPHNLISATMIQNILKGAGLTCEQAQQILQNTEEFFKNKMS